MKETSPFIERVRTVVARLHDKAWTIGHVGPPIVSLPDGFSVTFKGPTSWLGDPS